MVDDLSGYLFSWVKGFIKDIVFGVVIYSIGWAVLKCITLGSYPKISLRDGVTNSENQDNFSLLVGGAIVIYLVFQGYKFWFI